ncbi:hypothetical protein BD779DRAFT_1554564, partial [Infundibulicybe gibba]
MGHQAVVKLLLAQDGVDVNAVDSKGKTPLDWAGGGKRRQATIELLQAAGGRFGTETAGRSL